MADIARQLWDALDRTVKGGRTLYAVATEAGVKPEIVYQFHKNRSDMRLSSAGKVAAVLGLILAPAGGADEERTARPGKKPGGAAKRQP